MTINYKEELTNALEDKENKNKQEIVRVIFQNIPKTKELNVLLQNELNPSEKDKDERDFGDIKFREQDRVMQTKNNSKKEVFRDGLIQYGVYNGDCGKIIEISPETNRLKVEFDDGRIAE